MSEDLEYVVTDTPFLVNIKGCGYPPDVVCDLFAEKYDNHSKAGETFPCHYSQYNPWIVISHFNRDETVSAIMSSLFIPNIIFVVSVAVLVYWSVQQQKFSKTLQVNDFSGIVHIVMQSTEDTMNKKMKGD